MSGALVWAIPIAILGFVALVAFVSVKSVPEWARMVVFRLGKTGPDLVFGPGFRLVLPFVDRPKIVDMREQTVRLPRQTVVTSDGSPRGIDCRVRYQIVDALASEINVYNFRVAVEGVTSTMLREFVRRTHLRDLQTRRTSIAEDVHVKLGEVVAPWGGRVIRVEITEIGSPNRTASGDAVVAY
jgi:regulator of protease activity HflC (stomatin/prohibitin superfamily)